jgi:hypothetical protein
MVLRTLILIIRRWARLLQLTSLLALGALCQRACLLPRAIRGYRLLRNTKGRARAVSASPGWCVYLTATFCPWACSYLATIQIVE